MAFNPVNQKMTNTVGNIGKGVDIIEMKEIPQYDYQDYDLEDPKEFKKYIAEIKKTARASLEYKTLINYIKNYMDMNQCSFLKDVTSNGTNNKIKIHIHHSPITMEEICVIVYNKREFYMESLEVEQVAKEVLYLHYLLYVGLIPLSETPHELVHSGYLFIPNDKVFGRYNDFLERYGQWIPDEMKAKFDNIEEYTKTYNREQNSEILRMNAVYINMEDENSKLPTVQDIALLTKQRMNYDKLLQSANTTDINE